MLYSRSDLYLILLLLLSLSLSSFFIFYFIFLFFFFYVAYVHRNMWLIRDGRMESLVSQLLLYSQSTSTVISGRANGGLGDYIPIATLSPPE